MSRFRRLALFAFFLLIGIGLAACMGASSSQANLDGTEWKLVSLNGQPLVAGTHITLVFTAEGVSGYAGCNWYGTVNSEKYSATNGILTLPLMAITARGCSRQGIGQQEEAYYQILRNVTVYHLNGDQLELGNAANPRALVYNLRPALAMDPQQLVGTRWQLRSVDGQPLPSGAAFTLVFENGTVISQTGCYTYRSTFTAQGDRIRFPSTELLTPDCNAQVQPEVSLSTATHYRLGERELEIETDDYGTLLFEPLLPEVTVTPN